MPTITYSNPVRCQGGGHVTVDVTVNGGASRRVAYTVDEIRAPLAELSHEDRETLALLILKLHFAGRTRGQMVTEFQSGPVTVTI